MNPLISVMVPVYNVENYLPRCLDSILAQTYSNLEILLVDDGSRDSSGQICDSYAERDSRVRVIHKENQGVASARNTLVAEARGEYLTFVDSDDYLGEDALRVLYERMARDGSDMAMGRHKHIFADGSSADPHSTCLKEGILTQKEFLEIFGDAGTLTTALWAKLWKREAFALVVFPQLKSGEDTWVWTQLLPACRKISVADEVVYFYFIRENSIVHTKSDQTKLDALTAETHMVNFFLERDLFDCACSWYYRCLGTAVKIEEKPRATELLSQNFDSRTRKKMLKNLHIKAKIKSVSLYAPFLYDALAWLYRPIKQRRENK